jgi:hypothetical protein
MEVLTQSEVYEFIEIARSERNTIVRLRNELFIRIAYFT